MRFFKHKTLNDNEVGKQALMISCKIIERLNESPVSALYSMRKFSAWIKEAIAKDDSSLYFAQLFGKINLPSARYTITNFEVGLIKHTDALKHGYIQFEVAVKESTDEVNNATSQLKDIFGYDLLDTISTYTLTISTQTLANAFTNEVKNKDNLAMIGLGKLESNAPFVNRGQTKDIYDLSGQTYKMNIMQVDTL